MIMLRLGLRLSVWIILGQIVCASNRERVSAVTLCLVFCAHLSISGISPNQARWRSKGGLNIGEKYHLETDTMDILGAIQSAHSSVPI